MKFGLVFRGPVALGTATLSDEVIEALLALAENNGYAFLRFTHSNESLMERFCRLPNSLRAESFPFDRDPPRSLIVTQAESDATTLASFQAVARRNIRAAESAGYVISCSDSQEEYQRAWPMFERLAERKQFNLSHRTLKAWINVVDSARRYGCSKLYVASLDGACVSAIHLLRYGQTVEFMLGALDLEMLGKNPSPSALLHWRAMRDFYRSGCRYYNLGGPGDGVRNKVYQFKQKFRPEFRSAPPPVTIVLNRSAYAFWDLAVLKGWVGMKRQVGRVRGKGEDLIRGAVQKAFGPSGS